MIYIDGLGQVNSQVQATANQNNSVSNSFEEILVRETEKLSSDGLTINLSDIFDEASKTYNVSVDLLKAVAYQESGFQADATSYVGAMGIMQLMPSTAASLGVENPYDPYENIMGGAKLLSTLQDMYDGNIPLMLAGYNAGPGNVEKYGGVPPFEETQNYVNNIVATLNGQTQVDSLPADHKKTPDVITVTDSMTSATNDALVNNKYNQAYPTTVDGAISKTVEELLKSINTSAYKRYNTANMNSVFSYSDYEILIKYFDHMMEIISNIGRYDSDISDSARDSFSNSLNNGNALYAYGNNTLLYNKNNIKFF